MKHIPDNLAIDLKEFLYSKRAGKEARDLLARLECNPDMRVFERMWIMVFRTTEVRPEHANLQSAISTMSNNQCETFLTGEYGDKKLGICIMFKCELSAKQIRKTLEDYLHGRWDSYLLAPVPSAWSSQNTRQLNRWLNNL